jgi:hypothetical protein
MIGEVNGRISKKSKTNNNNNNKQNHKSLMEFVPCKIYKTLFWGFILFWLFFNNYVHDSPCMYVQRLLTQVSKCV